MKAEYLNQENIKIPDKTTKNVSSELQNWLEADKSNGCQESLYLINTRLWLEKLSRKYKQNITVSQVPDEEWHKLFEKYDNFWFMGIYVPSQASKEHAQKYSSQYRYALPDINPQIDVAASPFALPEYGLNPQIADSWEEWDSMVEKLHRHQKKVIIDFIPNHTSLDHPWAKQHPEYYILGTQEQYQSQPHLYYPVKNDSEQTLYLAHGKDPNYPQWDDTLQLNYAHTDVQKEMGNILLNLVDHADGVRCDMAMLVNPSTFQRTWGWTLNEQQRNYLNDNFFWKKIIPLAKEKAKNLGKDFKIIGEIYWAKEELDDVFDFIYDDNLYKLFLEVSSGGNPQILKPHVEYLLKNSREKKHCHDMLYTENHDEERSVPRLGDRLSKTFAVLSGIIPNSIFLVNQGQEEGFHIRPPMQINRFPEEVVDTNSTLFYDQLLSLKNSKLFRQGNWEMASILTYDPDILALKVTSPDHKLSAFICINPSKHQATCSVPEIDQQKNVTLISLTDPVDTELDAIRSNGIYVSLKPGEVQIIFSSPKKSDTEVVKTFRQNFAFVS